MDERSLVRFAPTGWFERIITGSIKKHVFHMVTTIAEKKNNV